MTERERPSKHGAILGEALSLLERAGREQSAEQLPEMCLTCAFKPGCMTNQMASTGLVALKCVLNLDADNFACHHGMKAGQPTRLCVGYFAAKLAPLSVSREVLLQLGRRLDTMEGPDAIRAAFDLWIDEIDPDRKMDDYQLARAHASNPPAA
jgi:hypothetical protein